MREGLGKTRKQIIAVTGELVTNVLYNIYECGCVLQADDDVQRYLMFELAGSNRQASERSCPNHKARLQTKYRKCRCGREYLSKTIHKGKTCAKCKHDKKFKKSMIRLKGGSIHPRGDYCRGMRVCWEEKTGKYKSLMGRNIEKMFECCTKCSAFDGIFRNVDPEKFKQMSN